MPFNWNPITTGFNDKLWELLKGLEAETEAKRFNVHPVGAQKNLTIGIGFDLNAGADAVRIAVYKGMGLKSELLNPPPLGTAPPTLTAEQQIELGYLNQLNDAIAERNQGLLNDVMAARNATAQSNAAYATYIGSSNPRTTFTFQNDDEVRAVFDDLWPNVYREIIFAKYPFLTTDSASHSSQEMLTLASLSWNGGGALLGPKLRDRLRRICARIQVSGGAGRNRGAGRGICGRRAVRRGLRVAGFAAQGRSTVGSRSPSGRLREHGSAWTGGLNFLSADELLACLKVKLRNQDHCDDACKTFIQKFIREMPALRRRYE